MHKVSSLYPNEPTYMHIKNINLGKFNDLDVSFLARFLCAEDEVTDETIPWNWDYLYASVNSDLREEWLLEEEANEEVGYRGIVEPNHNAHSTSANLHNYSRNEF